MGLLTYLNKINWFKFYTLSSILLAILGTVCVAFFLLYPYKTIEFRNEEQKIITPLVGTAVIYEIDYCKYTNASAVAMRALVDGYTLPLVPVESTLPKGCGTKRFVISIPTNTPAGKYYIQINLLYKVNPIREIMVSTRTEEFTVL